jgi:O-antigen ligase
VNASLAAAGDVTAPREDRRLAALEWLDKSIFIMIFGVALFAPVWTKAAVLCFRVGLVLWMVELLSLRPKLPRLAIVKPMLAYLLLVFLSTLFSPLPALSWGRMRTVELLLLALLVACRSFSRVHIRALIGVLTLATLVAAGYSGWQYARGIGVKPAHGLTPALFAAGWRGHDVIQSVDGMAVRTPAEWAQAIESQSSANVALKLLHGEPPMPISASLPRALLVREGLLQSGAMATARPQRAQGFFYSYIPFSEVLMLMAVLAFGLCVSFAKARKATSGLLWAAIFLILFATLVSTETRAAVAAVLLLGAAMVWLVAAWRVRVASVVILILLFAAGSAWFRSERAGIGWLGRRDAGTDYRLLMWKDGVRLAMEHPLVGIGMDTVERRGRELHIAAYEKYPNLKSHFHSTYVQIAAECGLPALAAWLWLMAAIFGMLWRNWRQNKDLGIFERGVALGTLASVAVFCLASVVHYTLGDAEMMVVLWMLLGIGIHMSARLETAGNPALP